MRDKLQRGNTNAMEGAPAKRSRRERSRSCHSTRAINENPRSVPRATLIRLRYVSLAYAFRYGGVALARLRLFLSYRTNLHS